MYYITGSKLGQFSLPKDLAITRYILFVATRRLLLITIWVEDKDAARQATHRAISNNKGLSSHQCRENAVENLQIRCNQPSAVCSSWWWLIEFTKGTESTVVRSSASHHFILGTYPSSDFWHLRLAGSGSPWNQSQLDAERWPVLVQLKMYMCIHTYSLRALKK